MMQLNILLALCVSQAMGGFVFGPAKTDRNRDAQVEEEAHKEEEALLIQPESPTDVPESEEAAPAVETVYKTTKDYVLYSLNFSGNANGILKAHVPARKSPKELDESDGLQGHKIKVEKIGFLSCKRSAILKAGSKIKWATCSEKKFKRPEYYKLRTKKGVCCKLNLSNEQQESYKPYFPGNFPVDRTMGNVLGQDFYICAEETLKAAKAHFDEQAQQKLNAQFNAVKRNKRLEEKKQSIDYGKILENIDAGAIAGGKLGGAVKNLAKAGGDVANASGKVGSTFDAISGIAKILSVFKK